MQCCTNRIQRWGLRYAIGACLALGVCVLIATTGNGQQESATPPGARKAAKEPKSHKAVPKKPARDRAVPKPGGHAAKAELRVDILEGASEQQSGMQLEMTSDFEFNDVPLDKVIQRFRGLTKLEILLDNKALGDVGIGSDTPITFSAQGVSANRPWRSYSTR